MQCSVLRVADQRAGRFPELCVLAGVATDNAARVRAVEWDGRRWPLSVPGLAAMCCWVGRRASFSVALPVCAEVWSRWRRRVIAGQAAVTFGLVLLLVGIVGRAAPLAVIGAVVAGTSFALWARANRNWWVTCRYDPPASVVVVEPTHERFDEAARALFVRSLS